VSRIAVDDAPLENTRLDGRLARSQRSRHAIVEAMRSLHHDGVLRPTAAKIADRAGVSLRTVWQHFEDLESLFIEAGRVDAEIALSFYVPIDPGAALDDRIARLVDQRSKMYDACAPIWRAARLQEPFSAELVTNRQRMVALSRRQVAAVFRPEITARHAAAKESFTDAVNATLGWQFWESLGADECLPPAAVRSVVITMLTALLRDASA
jgi:TetR/AcrR family transcriptional regulator, regulator of autoinduction and epiphytic fitness